MFPTRILKNQYGEVSNNYEIGGSGALWCQFKVDAANANGLGISGLMGNGIASVFMKTSQTPATGNLITAAGLIQVLLNQAYPGFILASASIQSPNTGSSLTSLTAGVGYIINALGTTTAAQWVTAGLPVGVTPAIGCAFVAAASASLGGTGTVQAAGVSGTLAIEALGLPGATSNPSSGGASCLLHALSSTNSSTTTLIGAAPADGSIITLQFKYDGIALES